MENSPTEGREEASLKESVPKQRRGRPFVKGQSGNPAGKPPGPNKATVAIKDAARKLLEDPAYQTELKVRLVRGDLAPAVESLLYHYAYGKPKESMELSTPDGRPLTMATIMALPREKLERILKGEDAAAVIGS